MIKAAIVQVGSQKWIRVKFRKRDVIAKKIRSIPGFFYNTKTGYWGIPYSQKDRFIDLCADYLIVWDGGDDSYLPPSMTRKDEKAVIDYPFKLKPYSHQIEGFNRLIQDDCLILGDDPGLGKTMQVATAMDALRIMGQSKLVLIIAKSSLVYNWRDEIKKHTGQDAVIIEGSTKKRDELFGQLGDQRIKPFFIITSYGLFKKDVEHYPLMERLSKGEVKVDTIILDEAHVIKNPNSVIGKAIHRMEPKRKFALTGTPIINRPLEFYNYLKWFGLTNMNYWAFEKKYAVKGGYGNHEVIGYQNIQELMKMVHSHMLRRRKRDVLDLPETIFKTIRVPMTTAQKKLYTAYEKNLKETLTDMNLDVAENGLTKLLRFMQITDSPELLGVAGKSSKLEALDELLESYTEDRKVIVFSRFKEMIKILEKRYGEKYNPAIITGDVASQAKKGEAESERMRQTYKFQQDETCRLFLGTSPACREGLTLTEATVVIFLDLEWAYSYFQQSYSRAERIGMKNDLLVINLVCEDTIDEHVEKLVMEKKGMSDTMVDTPFTAREIWKRMMKDVA